MRFYDPSAGRVLVDGVDLRDLHPRDLRRAVALVPQEPVIFAASVVDNIAYGREDLPRETVEDAARRAAAEPFIRDLPGRGLLRASVGAWNDESDLQRLLAAL